MRIEIRNLNGNQFVTRHWGDASKPKLLMLHGFPEFGDAWEDLAPLVAHRFHCIAPDQRGYGGSFAPANVGAYTFSNLVADMTALIGNVGPITIIGHDWGAAVAYGLAMFQPNLVKRLIVVNGVHPVPFQRAVAAGGLQSKASQYINYLRSKKSDKGLEKDDFAKLIKLFSANMDMSWLAGKRLANYKTAWRTSGVTSMVNWYRASPLVIASPGMPAQMPCLPIKKLFVKCPHLLIWGINDVTLLPQSTDGLEEFASNLTRANIADADHWVLHQKPREVADIILDWMS
ncbi:MAG: alpha/beta hydrolase [Tateyamaria sp.]|nr:alpha/beta hydrolase [Tateyamaria sp.]MDG1419941.1 alpha/beta hydrolase [Tateyamaria sp.]MDG2379423.1 alpha/beta hydrolase [Tateyamaria sp.]